MRPHILRALAVVLLGATAGLAQVNYEPTPAPTTSAAAESWYLSGQPIPFAGNVYFQTGPTVTFNRNSMVPTGSYDGVTLYADTTVEPWSLVFVPVGGNLVRPYERLRTGDLAGTTGSRAPTFPVSINRYDRSATAADFEDEQRTSRRARVTRPAQAEPEASQPEEPREELLVQTVRKPQGTNGMWISFQGYRWTQEGEAVTLDPIRFSRVGDYYGLPVFADARTPYLVYVPLRDRLLAPFRRATP